MSITIFNACLALGWLLALCGGLIVAPGPALIGAGVLLIVLAFMCARFAGGLFVPEPKADEAA